MKPMIKLMHFLMQIQIALFLLFALPEKSLRLHSTKVPVAKLLKPIQEMLIMQATAVGQQT